MYRLYKKNELNFSLVWIISYVVLFSVADSFSASLGTEKIIAAPVAIVFTLLLLVCVLLMEALEISYILLRYF